MMIEVRIVVIWVRGGAEMRKEQKELFGGAEKGLYLNLVGD